MATFNVSFPDDFIPRLITPLSTRIEGWEGTPIGQKILTAWNKPNVAALTQAEKAEFFCLIQLWKIVRDTEVDDARRLAIEGADADALNDFNAGGS